MPLTIDAAPPRANKTPPPSAAAPARRDDSEVVEIAVYNEQEFAQLREMNEKNRIFYGGTK
jgi:hypothetical protein